MRRLVVGEVVRFVSFCFLSSHKGDGERWWGWKWVFREGTNRLIEENGIVDLVVNYRITEIIEIERDRDRSNC